MSGPLYRFLSEDHARLDRLLELAPNLDSPDAIEGARRAHARAGYVLTD